MSQRFGEMRQIAFVVHDIDRAMKYWTQTLGVGPFFIKRNVEFANFIYRGNYTESPVVSIALANSGQMQIELIQQHDETPSIYQEFLDNNNEGLQHVSSWMTHEAMMNRKDEILAQDIQIAQECVIPSSGVNLLYFDTNLGNGGFIFEISDLMEPIHQQRIQNIAKAAQDWNGQDPVREVNA
jgi:hypothetical protein